MSYYKIIFRNTLNKDFRRQLFIKRYRCWSIIFRVTLNKDFLRQLFIKRYQFWSHETKQFYVLIIIIIINPLFSVGSKSIIKTNKYQLTKKLKYTSQIYSYGMFRVLRNLSNFSERSIPPEVAKQLY